jgi:hypothetical protein
VHLRGRGVLHLIGQHKGVIDREAAQLVEAFEHQPPLPLERQTRARARDLVDDLERRLVEPREVGIACGARVVG